jgi:3-oxoacyl-[acyl-carrier protein] reductase
MRVEGKTPIVTGAGSGFGAGIAQTLAREGAAVIVNDVNADGGNRVASQINDAGGRALFVRADVTSAREV